VISGIKSEAEIYTKLPAAKANKILVSKFTAKVYVKRPRGIIDNADIKLNNKAFCFFHHPCTKMAKSPNSWGIS
jgi:hypothetical protein